MIFSIPSQGAADTTTNYPRATASESLAANRLAALGYAWPCNSDRELVADIDANTATKAPPNSASSPQAWHAKIA